MLSLVNFSRAVYEKRLFERAAAIVFSGEKISPETKVSLVLAGEKRIRLLNRKYRKENRATDTLSFPSASGNWPKTENDFLGEIIICPYVIKQNCLKSKIQYKQEMALAVIHGLLHLIGYDHEKGQKQAEQMFEKQNQYFLKLFKKQ